MDTFHKLDSFTRSSGCSLYVLLNGYVAYQDPSSDSFVNNTLHYPYLFLTNCSNKSIYNLPPQSLYTYIANGSFFNQSALPHDFALQNYSSSFPIASSYLRDSFLNGFITICYILSAVSVAAWSLVLLLVLSPSQKSKISSFLVLFYAITISVVLSKTTKVLDAQFIYNYQDADEFQSQALHHKLSFAFTIIVRLLTILSWGDILMNLYSIRFKSTIRNFTGLAFVLLLVFNTLSYITDSKAFPDVDEGSGYLNYQYHQYFERIYSKTKAQVFYTVMTRIVDFFIYSVFPVCVYIYIFVKRDFAFLKQVVALTLFTSVLLVCPFIFYLTSVVSNKISNWATLMSDFFPILISILVWELYYKIQKYEKINEQTTVLGRQILNDDLPKLKRIRSSSEQTHLHSHTSDAGAFSSYHFRNPILKGRQRTKLGRFAAHSLKPSKLSSLAPFKTKNHNSNSASNAKKNKNNESMHDGNANENGDTIQLHNLTEIQLGTPVDPQNHIQMTDSPFSEYNISNSTAQPGNHGNAIVHYYNGDVIVSNDTPLSQRPVPSPIDQVLESSHNRQGQ